MTKVTPKMVMMVAMRVAPMVVPVLWDGIWRQLFGGGLRSKGEKNHTCIYRPSLDSLLIESFLSALWIP